MAGQYRQSEVDAFPPYSDLPPHPSQVPGEMLLFGRELAQRTAATPISAAEEVSLGIWAHMELVRIHPFQEGNGRTARLVFAAITMRHVTGPTRPLIFPSDPHHKERYNTAVKQYRQHHPEPFEEMVTMLIEADAASA